MMKIRMLYVCICAVALTQAFCLAEAKYDRRTPVVEAVEKALPSVVNISTTKEVTVRQSPFGMRSPFFDFGFPFRDRTYQLEGLGSGVIVEGGYIITNNHVVDYDFGPADKIFVTIYGENKPHEAVLVGTDPMDDIAVLQFKGKVDYTPLPWGRSDDLMVGETVIAMGSSLGQPFTVTEGIISALDRTIEGAEGVHLSNLIQTNADINRGNSGGPLVNINGKFIGLNTAIMSPSGGSVGLGFAIPIARVKKIFDYWVHKKLTVEDQLKIYLQDLTAQLVYFYHEEYPNLRDEKLHGVVITEVIPGGLADGKLQKIDIITSVNETPIRNRREFSDALDLLSGRSVDLGIIRDGKRQTITIRFGEQTITTVDFLGMELQELDAHWRKRLDAPPQWNFPVVTSVHAESIAGREGIQRGDVLESVRIHNRIYEIYDLDDIGKIHEAIEPNQPVMVEVLRKRNTYNRNELSWRRLVFRFVPKTELRG